MFLINFFKQGFTNIGYWIRRSTRIRQLKSKQNNVQDEIQKRQRAIGKEIYRNRGQMPSDQGPIDNVCRDIAQLEEQLFALEQEILNVKRMAPAPITNKTEISYITTSEKGINCKKCNAVLPVSAGFCGQCGMRIIQNSSKDTNEINPEEAEDEEIVDHYPEDTIENKIT